METQQEDIEKDRQGASSSDHGGSESYSGPGHATEPCSEPCTEEEEENIEKDRGGASSTDLGGSESYSGPDYATDPYSEPCTELMGWGDDPPVVHSVSDEENGELDEVTAEKGVVPWNHGSALHYEGRCRPCAFVRTDTGCRANESCRFCHFEHAVTRQRLRPCKGKRIRIHKLLERLKYEVDEYIASGRPMFGLSDHLSSLELPPMVQTNETLKKTVFAQTLIHMEETYGFRLVESL
mmetsp:Transcript_95286/g.246753  ORF Transcript_95286/g.246753 Transcript_95286/m.246753 type:complete len:238 (-) Transcript_95286:34-747(-)